MYDEEQARRALRSVVDEPPPPALTSVTDVIQRGRRRVLAQRVGAVAGVVAVVAGIGATSLWLTSNPAGDSPGLDVATSTAPEPTSTKPPLPGWTTVDAPVEEIPTTTTEETTAHGPPASGPESVSPPPAKQCETQRRLPVPVGSVLLPKAQVQQGFTEAVTAITGGSPAISTSSWEDYSPTAGGARGYIELILPVGDHNEAGRIGLENINYGGTPRQAADIDVSAYGNCERPIRRVEKDGTVLQMYLSGGYPQALHVYRSDGRLYLINLATLADLDGPNGEIQWGGPQRVLDAGQAARMGEQFLPFV